MKPIRNEELGNDWWEVWLDQPLRRESRLIRSREKRGFINFLLLDELRRLPNRGVDTILKAAFRAVMNEAGIPLNVVNDGSLEIWYRELSKLLDHRYGLSEAFRTRFERRFLATFQQHSKHIVIPGAWIGPYCVDIFCPTYRVGSCVGVAFEIDGVVHDREEKGLKDAMKDEYLANLNILVEHIENRMVSTPLIRRHIEGLGNLEPPDSNSVRNKMRRIKVETIAWHVDRKFFQEKLGMNKHVSRTLVELIFKHKRKLRGKFREYRWHL